MGHCEQSGASTRATHVLRDLVAAREAQDVALGDIVDDLGDRAFGMALLLLALPNCVPAPPGLGSILGLPLLVVGLRMAMGKNLWLPEAVRRRRIPRADALRILDRAERVLGPVERLLSPRLGFFFTALAERALGAVVVFLAAAIALPLPLTNMVPALATATIGLGLSERDGAAVAAGIGIGAIGLGLASAVVFAILIAPLQALAE